MRSKKRFRAALKEPSPTIDLTPLLDVTFVILIMFIVVVPFLKVDKIDLASSNFEMGKETDSVKSESPISITVNKRNEVALNKTKVTLQELKIALGRKKREYPKAIPQLFHDKEAHFGTYQAVKNTLESEGFEQVDVVLKP